MTTEQHLTLTRSGLKRHRAAGAVLCLALMVTACGADAGGPEALEGSTAMAELLDRLPADTRYVAMVDVTAMTEALGIDREELDTSEPPPLLDADGDADGVARALGVLRSSAVPALLSPFTETYSFLDLGAIAAGVYAFEMGDGRWAALNVTSQPVEELEQGLEADGFEAQGNGRWLFPEEDETDVDDADSMLPSDRSTGGFPAVAVEPGLFIMASSTAALDALNDADGASDTLRAMIEGAGASWAIAAYGFEPEADPEVCQTDARALAIGDDGEDVHALILGGGEDVFATDNPLTVDEPTIVGDTTRYRLIPSGDEPAEQVVFNTLLDSSPFASC